MAKKKPAKQLNKNLARFHEYDIEDRFDLESKQKVLKRDQRPNRRE